MTGNREAPFPRNVRAVMPCGETIPLELVCTGRRRGKWRWICAWPLRAMPARIDWDFLPEETTVSVAAPKHGT